MEKAELIITALQQRIGEMAAQHELEKAMLRAEYTILQQSIDDKQKAIDEYSQSLSEKTNSTIN